MFRGLCIPWNANYNLSNILTTWNVGHEVVDSHRIITFIKNKYFILGKSDKEKATLITGEIITNDDLKTALEKEKEKYC